MISANYAMMRPLQKRCRKLPAGGLGACPEPCPEFIEGLSKDVPQILKSPKIGG